MAAASSSLPLPVGLSLGGARVRVDSQTNPEAALVRRCQAGDQQAFQEIVERHQSKVFSIIYGIVRSRNDAEDIAQQVFTKVYFSIKNFDLRSSLLTWIYKITVNECYDVTPRSGKILLQNEGNEVYFRNFEIGPLEKE